MSSLSRTTTSKTITYRKATAERCSHTPDGARTWWAPFELTRINIAPTILRKKIEDLREGSGTIAKHCAVAGINRLSGTTNNAAPELHKG